MNSYLKINKMLNICRGQLPIKELSKFYLMASLEIETVSQLIAVRKQRELSVFG